MAGISERTIHHQFEVDQVLKLSSKELDARLKPLIECFPTASQQILQGGLQSEGFIVSWLNIKLSLSRIDYSSLYEPSCDI